jgi:aminomethyltransferase
VTVASRRTPLYGVHLSCGATMTDFGGWRLPVRYSSETAEHNAVRTAAGLFDLSHMGEIEIVGADAASALDYALVSDISAMVPGKAKYTVICRADGGILDDLVVYRLDDRRFLVVANAANAATVVAELRERSKPFDVDVHDRTSAWALLAIQGPRASEIVSVNADVDAQALPYYRAREATMVGHDVLLARTGYTGEDGFEVFCEPDDAGQIWELFSVYGADRGLVPAGLACRNTLRLEAGMPLYGHELTVDVTPYEAGLGRLVCLGKPDDFIGREALAARATADVSRQLVGLIPVGQRVPRSGYAVLDSTGALVGKVTSGAPSPTLGHPIAMAYIDVRCAAPGSTVGVDIRGNTESARVVDLPFYRRKR